MTKIIGISAGFDPTVDQYITGSYRFSLDNGQLQLLLTDDPTLSNPTYIFGIYNHPSWASTVFGDTRLVDNVNGVGYAATVVDGADSYAGIYNNGGEMKLWLEPSSGNVHIQMNADVLQLQGIRYADTTALALAIPNPAQDQYVMVSGKGLAVYDGLAWVHAADDTTPINNALGGGGGIETWTPTELANPLLITGTYTGNPISISQVGSDSQYTGTSTGIHTSVNFIHTVAGENGVYLKLMTPDNGTLPSGAEFRIAYTDTQTQAFPTTNVSAPFASFVKQVGDVWQCQLGCINESIYFNIPDAQIHEAEICVSFEIVSDDVATVKVYTSGSGTPVGTKTITQVGKMPYFKFLQFYNGGGGATITTRVIGVPASPISGVTQFVTSGLVDSTDYPATRADKTFQVTGLSYNLIDATSNKVISNGCLVTFDSNGNLSESTSSANEIVFYHDHAYRTIMQDGDALWSNGTTQTTLSSGTMALATRREHVLDQMYTPNGDTLNKYKILNVRPQIRSDSMWLTPGWIYSAGGQGTTADNHINASSQHCIVIQSGSVRLSNDSGANCGTTNSITASTSAKHARIRIVARK
jgi:hypothetical protein